MMIVARFRFGVVLLAGTILSACSQSAEPPTAPAARSVSTLVVVAGQTTTQAALSGDVRAQVEDNIAFRASGRVQEVLADVGDHVTAGQTLARLNDADQQASLALAAASVRSAQAELDQAQRAFDRIDALFQAGNTTRAQADAARATVDAAEGALAAAQSQQDSAAELVTYAELVAGADGIVLSRSLETGQVVAAGQTVFTLAEDGPRDAVFNVYEAALADVPRDISVALTLLADPSVTATGHVREIAPTINAATGTVRIKVGFDDAADVMPLGAAVGAVIDLPPRSGVTLPWSALSRDANGPAVWVVDTASNTVDLHPVVVDRYLADTVLVSTGLADGELVVVSGTQLLYPGEAIAVKEATP
ncbi:MAG: efflux RND transporter periplasmic adaptor subunit [Devosia sp.]